MSDIRLAVVVLSLICAAVQARALSAAEYFVSLQGRDDHDGLSEQSAFATVQRGVDALAPGDTLTILPGEYHEAVYRQNLGSAELDTVIRARIPRTVVLRGDVQAPAFTLAPGCQFTYVTDLAADVQGVLEAGTPRNLLTSTTQAAVETTPGTWFHDRQQGKLYVSTSDLQPPDHHQYRVAVIPRFGLHLDQPRRVVIEGLVTTGFHTHEQQPDYPGYYAVWGIMLSAAQNCVVRHCVAYLNAGGIAIHSARDGGHNLIEHCTAFANGNIHSVEGGNICVFSSNHDTVQHCTFYLAQGNGHRHYGAGIRGPAVTRHCLGWGNRVDYFLKGGKVPQFGLVEHCVSLGKLYSHNVSNNLIGDENQYNREPAADNIRLFAELPRQADWNQQFADPANLDFRLQPNSKFRGSGPDGGDRGPFAYTPNIFYVRPDGDDNASGLSLAQAWRSLQRATRDLKPGDTLYLEPGTYASPSRITLGADGAQTIAIRGRGIQPVIINGTFAIHSGANLLLERLNFAGGVELRDGRHLAFRNCRFFGGDVGMHAAAVRGLRMTHNQFSGLQGPALRLRDSSELFLSGNLLDNTAVPAVELDTLSAVLYADYNAYRDGRQAWSVGGAVKDLSQLRPAHERYAKVMSAVYRHDEAVPALVNDYAFRSGGPEGGALGLHLPYRPQTLHVSPPTVHSVTATTANIEWRVARPADCTIAWGQTPACENELTLATQEFGSYSLSGLTPGTTYYFALRALEPRGEGDQQMMARRNLDAQPIAFTTLSHAEAPRTFYVAPDGDDANTGLSRAQAWRHVATAAARVAAGDTVLVAEGTYTELVHVRATGDVGLPITFKPIAGQRVTFDGANRLMNIAFSLARKKHVHIDGFYFTNFGLKGWESIISLFDSSHIRITRCFMNNRGKGYPTPFLYALGGEDIAISNCVIANGTYGLYTTGATDLRIENCVFLRNFITACTIRSPVPKGAHLVRNIISDSIVTKLTTPLFEISGGVENYTFRDNCFHLRVEDAQRKCLYFYGSGPGRLSVAEYETQSGIAGNVLRDPQFARAVGQNPVDGKGQPISFITDWLFREPNLDFPDLFTTDPELMQRGIGLDPKAFEDFVFTQPPQPAAAR